MDCLEAQAILSAAHDGEAIEPADLAAAREHCADCADCRAFAEGLEQLAALPTPPAPPETIDAILGRVAELAAARAEADLTFAAAAEAAAAEAVTEAEDLDHQSAAAPADPAAERTTMANPPFAWFTDSVKWASIGALGAVAVTALIAFVLVSTAGTRVPQTAESSTTSGGSADFTFSNSNKSATVTAAAPQTQTRTTAPDYVAYKNLVYAPGALLADSSEATPQVGTISTAFASGSAAAPAPVYGSPLADGSIVVKGPDGYRLYTPVVRLLASRRFQLEAGNSIDHFGVWPTLPARFTPPTGANGSPTFGPAGQDSLGVNVFVPSGQSTSAGFAVAPGTGSSDPAQGDPNWTWWTPVIP